MDSIFITKADGTRELFRINKLEASLRRAGARKDEIRSIVEKILSSLTDGIKTQEIYRHAFELLRESNHPVAAKYSLRRAIFSLGPTGFPFEDFLGRLYEAQGYKTKQRLILKGKCVTHEIDLAAYSPAHSFVAEAKFHAQPGIKSDLQVALYSYARFLDLKDEKICKGDSCGIISLKVITNTKFTDAATKYATCAGIDLLSWDYPKNQSLHDLIETYKVYPVTVLTHLSTNQKQALMREGTILCSDILKTPERLQTARLAQNKSRDVIEEVSRLCSL
jgi:hypothetical protein